MQQLLRMFRARNMFHHLSYSLATDSTYRKKCHWASVSLTELSLRIWPRTLTTQRSAHTTTYTLLVHTRTPPQEEVAFAAIVFNGTVWLFLLLTTFLSTLQQTWATPSALCELACLQPRVQSPSSSSEQVGGFHSSLCFYRERPERG